MRLEAQIDELAARIQSCRKFIVAGRIAVAGGGVVLVAMVIGAIRLDPDRALLRVTAYRPPGPRSSLMLLVDDGQNNV